MSLLMRSEKYVDMNLLSPQDMDELLYSPFQQAIGKNEWERLQRQISYYNYYEGKQHIDPSTGQLVRGRDLEKPSGLDYKPTRYTTNLLKSFILKKSRWQFGSKPNVIVTPKQIDSIEMRQKEGYKPSASQQAQNAIDEKKEKLLMSIWKSNRMHERLLQASRDRLISGRIAVKIQFNSRSGKVHWIFKSDIETFPVFSDDDFEELIGCHFVRHFEEDGQEYIEKETFRLVDGNCEYELGVYDKDLELKEMKVKGKLYIDFIPVILFPNIDLTGEESTHSEFENLKELNDIINQLNEDSIDSLKFEMFSMTALVDVPEGTASKVRIAPNSVIEISGGMSERQPSIQKVEGRFNYKDALKEQYSRVKNAMHEISSVPNYSSDSLNFGGMNKEAQFLLFHAIIQDTEEHWVLWRSRLQELHEKTLRLLQSRMSREKTFIYDKEVLTAIGEDYDSDIRFALPLPDDRKELVELLALETLNGFESREGAMNRLGVDDVKVKKAEIDSDKKDEIKLNSLLNDPYGSGGSNDETGN